jgi:hypothetical protein
MKQLLLLLLGLLLVTECGKKSHSTNEPAGRAWMKDLYGYFRIKNVEVPVEYSVFEKKLLESPDRMGKLYDYLKKDSADVPARPMDFVEKITAGFPIADKPLVCVWMSLRVQDRNSVSEYALFKKDMSDSRFRSEVYGKLKTLDPTFTASYSEFSKDMGFTNKGGNIF